MIRTTLLSLTLIACNSFEAQDNANEPTKPSYKIVDASQPINVDQDTTAIYIPKNIVMTIPELGLEVIEQEPETETQPDNENPGLLGTDKPTETKTSVQDIAEDDIVKFVDVDNLLPTSELTAELTSEKHVRIVAISTFPMSALEESKTFHGLRVLLPEEKSVYTSEILQSIVLAVEYNANFIYIPLTAESMPEILFEGVEYANSEGTQVYDAEGNLL